jgi:hypothetical protein
LTGNRTDRGKEYLVAKDISIRTEKRRLETRDQRQEVEEQLTGKTGEPKEYLVARY